mgnify:FL=1
MYSIGQVSEMFGIPVSTLRYYDKEGLFPNLERSGSTRRFGEGELELLRVIDCLKKTGLEIRDIKRFVDVRCAKGAVRGAQGPGRGGDRAHAEGARHGEVQVLVL